MGAFIIRVKQNEDGIVAGTFSSEDYYGEAHTGPVTSAPTEGLCRSADTCQKKCEVYGRTFEATPSLVMSTLKFGAVKRPTIGGNIQKNESGVLPLLALPTNVLSETGFTRRAYRAQYPVAADRLSIIGEIACGDGVAIVRALQKWAALPVDTDAPALAGEARSQSIDLVIRSGGGSAFDGVVLAEFLSAFEHKGSCYVDHAASAAAIIAVSFGGIVFLHSDSYLLFHNPFYVPKEGSKLTRKALDRMDKILTHLEERANAVCLASGFNLKHYTWLLEGPDMELSQRDAKNMGLKCRPGVLPDIENREVGWETSPEDRAAIAHQRPQQADFFLCSKRIPPDNPLSSNASMLSLFGGMRALPQTPGFSPAPTSIDVVCVTSRVLADSGRVQAFVPIADLEQANTMATQAGARHEQAAGALRAQELKYIQLQQDHAATSTKLFATKAQLKAKDDLAREQNLISLKALSDVRAVGTQAAEAASKARAAEAHRWAGERETLVGSVRELESNLTNVTIACNEKLTATSQLRATLSEATKTCESWRDRAQELGASAQRNHSEVLTLQKSSQDQLRAAHSQNVVLSQSYQRAAQAVEKQRLKKVSRDVATELNKQMVARSFEELASREDALTAREKMAITQNINYLYLCVYGPVVVVAALLEELARVQLHVVWVSLAIASLEAIFWFLRHEYRWMMIVSAAGQASLGLIHVCGFPEVAVVAHVVWNLLAVFCNVIYQAAGGVNVDPPLGALASPQQIWALITHMTSSVKSFGYLLARRLPDGVNLRVGQRVVRKVREWRARTKAHVLVTPSSDLTEFWEQTRARWAQDIVSITPTLTLVATSQTEMSQELKGALLVGAITEPYVPPDRWRLIENNFFSIGGEIVSPLVGLGVLRPTNAILPPWAVAPRVAEAVPIGWFAKVRERAAKGSTSCIANLTSDYVGEACSMASVVIAERVSLAHHCVFNASADVERRSTDLSRHTPDGLNIDVRSDVHRIQEIHHGCRCGIHHSWNPHNWSPAHLMRAFNGGSITKPFKQFTSLVAALVIAKFEEEVPKGVLVGVTAACGNYENETRQVHAGVAHLVIFSNTKDQLGTKYAARKDVTVIEIPMYGASRSLAMWRYLPALVLAEGWQLLLLNRDPNHLAFNPNCLIEKFSPNHREFSVCPWNYMPANMSCHYVRSGFAKDIWRFLYILENFGDIYGADEIFLLARREVTVVYNCGESRRDVTRQTSSMEGHLPILVHAFIGDDNRWSSASFEGWNRLAVMHVRSLEDSYLRQLCSRKKSMEQVGEFAPRQKGFFITMDKEQWDTTVWPIAVTGRTRGPSLQDKAGPQVWFTFGSRGDRVPVEALARWQAGHGFTVFLVHLTGPEEGKRILALAEHGEALQSLPTYMDCQEAIEVCPHMKYSPRFIRTRTGLRYNCAPPLDIAYPLKSGLHFSLDNWDRIFEKWRGPHFSIGSYLRPGWLPRSHNGVDFLEVRENIGTIPLGIVMGSSSEIVPPQYAHLPAVPQGDHLEIFRRYKSLVTHGGAGTVQTAAAAGVTSIVSVSNKLDRDYKRPNDAGYLTGFGQDPDLVFVVMANEDWRFARLYYDVKRAKSLTRFDVPATIMKAGYLYLTWVARASAVRFLFNLLTISRVLVGLVQNLDLAYDPCSTIMFMVAKQLPLSLGICAVIAVLGGSQLEVIRELLHPRLRTGLGLTFSHLWRTIFSYSLFIMVPQIGVTALYFAPYVDSMIVCVYLALERRGTLFLSSAVNGPSKDMAGPIAIEITVRFHLVMPVFHTATVDTERNVCYEGTHFGDQQIGQNFQAIYREWLPYDGTGPYRILLPIGGSRENFDKQSTTRRRYHASWNCIAIIDRYLRKQQYSDVPPTTAAIMFALLLYSWTLIAVGMVFMSLLYGVASVLSAITSLEICHHIPLAQKAYQVLFAPGTALDPDQMVSQRWFSYHINRLVAGFGGENHFGDTRSQRIESWDLATIDDDQIDYHLRGMGVAIDRDTMRRNYKTPFSVTDKVAAHAYEVWNTTLDRFAFDQEIRRTIENVPKETFGSDQWHAWVRETVDRLLTSGGAVTASAFATWSREQAREQMVSSVDTIQPKINAFLDSWARRDRWTPAFVVATARFTDDLSKSLEPDTFAQYSKQLEPVPLSTLVAEGIHPMIRQKIREAQMFDETGGPANPVILADYIQAGTETLRGIGSVLDLQIFRRVARRGLSHASRWDPSGGPPVRQTAGPEEALDAAFAWLQSIGKPDGMNLDATEKGQVPQLFPLLTESGRVFLELLIRSPSEPLSDRVAHHVENLEMEAGSDVEDGEARAVTMAHLSQLMAMAVSSGTDVSNAWEAALVALHAWLEAREMRKDAEGRRRDQMLRQLELAQRQTRPPTVGETLIDWLVKFERFSHEVPLFSDALSCVSLAWRAFETALAQGATHILDVLLRAIANNKERISAARLTQVIDLFLELIEVVAVKSRVPAKVVWAPLFKKYRQPLTEGERLSMSIKGASNEIASYKENLETTIRILSDNHPDEPPELLRQYLRATYRPKSAYGTAGEFKDVPEPPSLIIDEKLEARVASYLAKGVPQGIDGIWLSDASANLASLSRYEPEPHPSEPGLEALICECADVIYDRHPEMFVDPKTSTPEQVWRYIEKRYSPGIPFIGKYASRRALFNTGWAEAIMRGARECLTTGVYPAQIAHAFTKMQVVDKEKLMKGKPVRTVVSQDLLTVFIDQMLFLERSKRPATVDVGIATGRPLTEAGMKDFFEQVLDRQRFMKADEKEYDANTSPAVFAGLVRLNERGFEGHANRKNIVKTVRTRYRRLQRGHIVELEGGEPVDKNRGGSTGQALTTWDNTWGARLKAMAAWSIITDKRPADFFKTNTFVNVSDDNMWGSDDDFNPHDLIQVYREYFGSTLEIEAENFDDLFFLGKKPKHAHFYEEDYELLGIPTPRFAIVADTANLLMRRSAFTTRVAGFKREEHFRARIMRTIGHGALAAHNRDLYTMMANEWMSDARELLKREVGSYLFEVVYDKNHHIIMAKVRDNVVPRSRHEANQLNFLRKAGRMLDYIQILMIDTRLVQDDALAYRAKKLAKLGPPTPRAAYLNHWVRLTRSTILSLVPDHLVGLAAEPDTPPLMSPFHVPDYHLEHFIYLKHQEHSKAGEPTIAELTSQARESPYRYVLDIPGYMWHRRRPEGKAELDKISLAVAQNYTFMMTALYVVGNRFAKSLGGRSSLAALFLETTSMMNSDLPRLYSGLGTVYWHLKGKASERVSSLQPKDPHLPMKQAARIGAFILRHSIPDVQIPGVIQDHMGRAIEMFAKIASLRPRTAASRAITGQLTAGPKWSGTAKLFVDSLATDEPYQVLASATATGKSTAFVAAVLQRLPKDKVVWLLEPRVVLKDNYNNPFLASTDQVVRMNRDTILGAENLIVATYGSFLARKDALDVSRDVILCDEFHESSPEQIAVEALTRSFDRLFMSATPSTTLYPGLKKILESGVPRPFVVHDHPLELDVPGLFAEAERAYPDLIKRSLIIVPTISEANKFMQQLRGGGYDASIMTRHERDVPPTGIIVATQVVDSGIDIDPPVDIVITSHEMIVANRGNLQRVTIPGSTLEQRKGRSGRRRDGHAFYRPVAGSGRQPVIYPNWGLFNTTVLLHERYKQAFGLIVTVVAVDDMSPRIMQNADPTSLRIDLDSVNYADDVNGMVVSLKIYYRVLCFTGDHVTARSAYDRLVGSGEYDEALAPVEREIRLMTMTTNPQVFSTIMPVLESSPFQTEINGKIWHHCGLCLREEVVTRVGTPHNPSIGAGFSGKRGAR